MSTYNYCGEAYDSTSNRNETQKHCRTRRYCPRKRAGQRSLWIAVWPFFEFLFLWGICSNVYASSFDIVQKPHERNIRDLEVSAKLPPTVNLLEAVFSIQERCHHHSDTQGIFHTPPCILKPHQIDPAKHHMRLPIILLKNPFLAPFLRTFWIPSSYAVCRRLFWGNAQAQGVLFPQSSQPAFHTMCIDTPHALQLAFCSTPFLISRS